MQGSVMLSIRLSNDVESRLNQLAETTGRTKTFYAKEAILKYLDDMEDTYIAINRLETPSKRISLEDVENELGLDD
jgi:RHH-type rel operon transcriptional repressor/antitoxin RelB